MTKIYTHEKLSVDPKGVEIFFIAPRGLGSGFLRSIFHAHRVLRAAKGDACIIANGGGWTGKVIALLNELTGHKRRVLMWESFATSNKGIRGKLVRIVLKGCDVVIVYSKRLREAQAQLHNLPVEKFVFVRYKANHSKFPPLDVPVGNFVFAGGNSSRDYQTLFDAVEGTDVQLVVSTTRPDILGSQNVPDNVILLTAREPYFARLMASSKFVVMPVVPGVVFGQAVANVSNAMWHGRAVVGADDAALHDYIEDGITGYSVPAGDVNKLREKILALWNDDQLCLQMGQNAANAVRADRTHELFWNRLLTIASECAVQKAQ